MANMYKKTDWNSYDDTLTIEENLANHAIGTKDLLNNIEDGVYEANKPFNVGNVTVTEDPKVEVIEDPNDPEARIINVGVPSIAGPAGKSSYEVAVEVEGYTGTELQWLATLKGAKGEAGVNGTDGKSAYEVAVDTGYAGTEAEWIASLKGDAGTPMNIEIGTIETGDTPTASIRKDAESNTFYIDITFPKTVPVSP